MKNNSEQMKMDAILSSLPWRCFHCDFVTSDPEEAEAHFGDCDDAGEFTPLCKWWSNMNDQERKEQFQALIQELNGEREENIKKLNKIEDLKDRLHSQESAIKSYTVFKECRSIQDIFNLYDSMEGRALIAEEREKSLVEAVNDAGFGIYLTDDEKTIIKKSNYPRGIPLETP